MVPLREVYGLLSRPSADGLWMPLKCIYLLPKGVLSSPFGDGSQSSFNSKCADQGLSCRCPNTGHLQFCGLIHSPDLRQVLWPRYAGHTRLFHSLALAVLLRDTHRTGTWKSGSMGISFPKGWVINDRSSIFGWTKPLNLLQAGLTLIICSGSFCPGNYLLFTEDGS